MADWIDRYRASVSWGDQITEQTEYTRDGQLRPIRCCWFPVKDSYTYVVSGTVANLPQVIADAAAVKASNRCTTNVLFTDAQATEAQVEEAMTVLAEHGFGCRFLEPQPDVLHLGLLNKYSEGTLMERLVHKLEGRSDA